MVSPTLETQRQEGDPHVCNKCESIHGYINPVSNSKFILEYSQELLTLNQYFMGEITKDFIQMFGGVDLKPSMISTIRMAKYHQSTTSLHTI